MKYRVRTKDGELTYSSFEEVLVASRQGFVEPGDDVQREGESNWNKAAAIPGLFSTPRRAVWNTPLFWWVAIAVNGALFSMWAIHRGKTLKEPELYGAGLVVVFLVAGILFKVVGDAQKPRR